MQIKRRLVVFGFALMACSDATSPTNASGSLTFTYTGAGSGGVYSATGSLPANLSQGPGTSPWAMARLEEGVSTTAFASRPTSSTTWDLVIVSAARQSVGTRAIDSTCTISNCSEMVLVVGSVAPDGANFQFTCTMKTGTVELITFTETRVTGVFSGTGTCATQAGVSSAFTVTGGTFDVPIILSVQG